MLVPLVSLWLPILLSAVFVFLLSSILWMALPFWHGKDYGKLPEEERVLEALSSAKTGQYVIPCLDWKKATPEQKAAAQRRPGGFLMLRNPARFSFGKALVLYFLYTILVGLFVAYICAVTLGPGTHYLKVFRVAGSAAMLAYVLGGLTDSVWYGKPWAVTLKAAVDGVLCGLVTAGTFGWLWPH